MVTGVDSGFSKMLELHGVGYRGEMRGAEPRPEPRLLASGRGPAAAGHHLPAWRARTGCIVRGSDKEAVGQTAADIRALRPPEPYKGKGIRYAGEYVRRKAGKAGKAAR